MKNNLGHYFKPVSLRTAPCHEISSPFIHELTFIHDVDFWMMTILSFIHEKSSMMIHISFLNEYLFVEMIHSWFTHQSFKNHNQHSFMNHNHHSVFYFCISADNCYCKMIWNNLYKKYRIILSWITINYVFITNSMIMIH